MSTIPNFPVDVANTLYATRIRAAIKPAGGAKSGATSATANIVTLADHGFADGDFVEFTSGTGFTGLTAGTIYVVRDAASGTFKLAPKAGDAAVEFPTGASAGVFSLVIGWESAKVDDESQAPSAESIEMPDNNGVFYPIRRDYGSQAEAYTVTSHEIRRITKMFNGALQGVRRGVAKLWIPDAALAQSGVTSPFLESEWFSCAVTRGGNVSFGDKKHSVATLKIESQKQGPITWTPYVAA